MYLSLTFLVFERPHKQRSAAVRVHVAGETYRTSAQAVWSVPGGKVLGGVWYNAWCA